MAIVLSPISPTPDSAYAQHVRDTVKEDESTSAGRLGKRTVRRDLRYVPQKENVARIKES